MKYWLSDLIDILDYMYDEKLPHLQIFYSDKNPIIWSVLLSVLMSISTDGYGQGTTQKSVEVKRTLSSSDSVLHISNRLELFVDEYLIKELKGEAELQLHHPTPREKVLVHDEPWEGVGSGFHSIFKDGDTYKMYYKAWDMGSTILGAYAESEDGLHWRKPNLGLYEFQDSKANNIVFIRGLMDGAEADGGHLAVFKDQNPDAAPDARYKAVLRSPGPKGVVPFKSADGVHWKAMSNAPVITDGAFDSQNLAFWDSVHEEYRAYWRYFDQNNGDRIRAIRTATSKDFINWSEPSELQYVDSPSEHLYTNVIKPYHRAPHILIGFPARYIDRGWSESMRALPELKERENRSERSRRYGTALTESLLMTSRDGVTFKRWNEAFLRPGMERDGSWAYGNQFIAWHIVETRSDRSGAPNELSLFAVEDYWVGEKGSALRRYTLRLDGFVSVSAPMEGGELITKPFTFRGKQLKLNFSSSAAGGIQVEIQDEAGNPIPGFKLEDSDPIFGDSIQRTVTWNGAKDVSALSGRPVRLRVQLRDADLYSFQFK